MHEFIRPSAPTDDLHSYTVLGIPLDFMVLMFAVPRVVGWLSHWRQQVLSNSVKIWRPRQVRGGSVDVFPAPGLLLIKRSPRRVPIAVVVVAGLRWTRETRLCARGGACWGGRPEEDAVEGRARRVRTRVVMLAVAARTDGRGQDHEADDVGHVQGQEQAVGGARGVGEGEEDGQRGDGAGDGWGT